MRGAETVRDVVHRLLDVLEPSGVPYALGGALALAAWSEPRATADVDLILWLPGQRAGEGHPVVFASPSGLGFLRCGVRVDASAGLQGCPLGPSLGPPATTACEAAPR